MALLYPAMCYGVQEVFNESKNTQFEVQTRKLWPQEVHNNENAKCR